MIHFTHIAALGMVALLWFVNKKVTNGFLTWYIVTKVKKYDLCKFLFQTCDPLTGVISNRDASQNVILVKQRPQ